MDHSQGQWAVTRSVAGFKLFKHTSAYSEWMGNGTNKGVHADST
jgi:hypothetical protein